MNKPLTFILGCLLAYGSLPIPAHAAEPEQATFNIAPFALPGTPAHEVRFEEPREIREVVVTFKTSVPDGLGLSYLHKTWRKERQELLETTQDIFQSGWKPIDDWFNVSWEKGAVLVEKSGSRKATLRFDMLGKEGVSFEQTDVDYRYTLGLRVDGVAPEAVEKIAVRTTSRPCRTKLRVTLDAGRSTPGEEVGLTAYNSEVLAVQGETGTEALTAHRVRLGDGTRGRRSFLVEVRHLLSAHGQSHDDGLLTFDLADKTFTISLGVLLTSGPIWYEAGGVYVTTVAEPTTFDVYQQEYLRRAGPAGVASAEGSIASMVVRRPEQSLGGVRLGQPERQPVPMLLGCKYNRNRFRVETQGDITMEMGGYWNNNEPPAHRFFFGLERWSRVANYTDPAPALIYHVERRNGALRLHQETFAVPLFTPIGDALTADEPTVCLVRFTLKNEGASPATACLPIEFSSHSRRTMHPYAFGERAGVPPGPRDALTLSDDPGGDGGATAERLLVATTEGKPEVRGSLRTGMAVAREGAALVLRQELAPGESCEALLKVARKPLTKGKEGSLPDKRMALARLDYDALRNQTVRFWNDQVAPWAELKTPEPDLNAFHKAHLAHVMISDHRMPGEEGFISTSVGADAYGNCGNESTMIIQELEERGLHEEARKRLAPWLKYQGTAQLNGRFSDQNGVFYGAGGSEVGESYIQHHGWIMWALAEHYFMTRDKAWLEGAAAQLIRGADWVVRQRKLTMGDRPLSRGWERGFLPAGGLEDVSDFYYWTTSNIWIWRGMDRTAAALAAIGHPEAGRLRAEADQYHADLLRGLTIARQHNPLVRLRDGRWVPHYPTQVYRRGRDLGWIRETLEGSVNLLLSGFLDPNGPEAPWILDDYQDNLYVAGEFGYQIPEFRITWFDWAGFSCQPNLLAGLMPYLDRDEIEVYTWMFFNAFNATYSQNIQGMVEHPRTVLGFSNPEVFKTSDQANSIKWLRYMFVYGPGGSPDGGTLHLGRALPREWLRGGQDICLKRVHTRYGVVSVEYETAADESRITCKADLAIQTAPARTLVRFRHPARKPIQSVLVNGVAHPAFDPVKGDVDVTGQGGALTIEARY